MTDFGLVINLGLKSVRAIAFDRNARKLATASRPIQTYLRDTWIEQDPDEWWEKAAESTKEALASLGSRSDPGFLTVSASAACLVPVDDRGKALRRAIMVSDRRAFAEASDLHIVDSAFVADPYYMAPKALWIQRHEPDVFRATRWMMSPGDFLLYRLTGEAVTDTLNAEKFFYDVRTARYPIEQFGSVGLDPSHLLPVASLAHQAGCVTAEAGAALGIGSGTPVVLSTYDAIAAFWGSGVSEEGDVADVSGTVTSVRALSRQAFGVVDQRVFTQAMPGTRWSAVGGSNNLGGGLIEWLKQSFYANEQQPYETMEAEAAASGPSGRGILFLPYLLGERCPIWDPKARGVFFGLERQHIRGDFARAVLESAAFGVEHVLRVLREHGVPLKRIRVSGGLARIRLVSIIKSDVSGLPVEVLEEFETAALGAFLMAGCGAGFYSSIEEAGRLVRVGDVISPDEARRSQYQDWFELYLKLYDTLRPLFRERHDLFVQQQLGGSERLENL